MKNITRILLALVLALTLIVPAFAEEAAAPVAEKGTIVYGASTEIGGDFAPGAWFTNNATDKMLRDLSNDYYTVVTDQGGAYVVNNTVCQEIAGEVNEDGTKTFTIKVKEGLTYNNGDPINIYDFAWYPVFSSSKLMTDLGAKLTGYLTYVGGQDYYDGKATTVSGVRIIDDSYNANPNSMRASLSWFKEISAKGKSRLLVLGDIHRQRRLAVCGRAAGRN